MHALRFDQVARALLTVTARRRALTALLLAALGLPPWAGEIAAGPGCTNVGRACERDNDCCSGVCAKGKKGKKKCRAHDTGGCRPGQQEELCGGAATITCERRSGLLGTCNTTTGNAGYCSVDAACFPCRRDADCREFCGSRAACLRCKVECRKTGGTACAGPRECDFPNG